VVLDVVGLQRPDHLLGQDHLVLHVERRGEVDVLGIERVPEMVVGGRDDLVERGRARVVAVEVEHRLEVVGRDRVVDEVLGDVSVGHAGVS
jgi:hypothetical protein